MGAGSFDLFTGNTWQQLPFGVLGGQVTQSAGLSAVSDAASGLGWLIKYAPYLIVGSLVLYGVSIIKR